MSEIDHAESDHESASQWPNFLDLLKNPDEKALASDEHGEFSSSCERLAGALFTDNTVSERNEHNSAKTEKERREKSDSLKNSAESDVCETAHESTNSWQKPPLNLKDEILRLWTKLDRDTSGVLTIADLGAALGDSMLTDRDYRIVRAIVELRFSKLSQSYDLRERMELRSVLTKQDLSILDLLQNDRKIVSKAVKYVVANFSAIDTDGNGFISAKELSNKVSSTKGTDKQYLELFKRHFRSISDAHYEKDNLIPGVRFVPDLTPKKLSYADCEKAEKHLLQAYPLLIIDQAEWILDPTKGKELSEITLLKSRFDKRLDKRDNIPENEKKAVRDIYHKLVEGDLSRLEQTLHQWKDKPESLEQIIEHLSKLLPRMVARKHSIAFIKENNNFGVQIDAKSGGAWRGTDTLIHVTSRVRIQIFAQPDTPAKATNGRKEFSAREALRRYAVLQQDEDGPDSSRRSLMPPPH